MHTSRTSRSSMAASTVTGADTSRRDTARMTARFREKNMNGTVGTLLNPVDGYRGELARKGIKPKDHARENIRAMREKQRENRLRKELEAEEGASGPFKLKRFAGVQSKVKDESTRPGTGRDSVKTHSFLRKDEGKVAASAPAAEAAKKGVPRFDRPPRAVTKPPVPKASDVAELAPREDKDFVRSNYKEAVHAAPARRRSEASSPDSARRRSGYGEVPKYLQERKESWREEEARRAAEAADDCPPGMTVMPEEERLETLAVLQESLGEANRQLARMPLHIETPGQVRRKTDLEAKVKELEDAIEIFSRDRVFVADDE